MAYTTTTLGTLRGRVRERLFNTFWTDDELNRYIVEAIRVWNVLTGYYQQRATISLTASTDGHSITTDIASDCLAPLRFINATTKKPYSTLSLRELSTYDPSWLSTAGTPSSWLPVGLDRFYLYPFGATGSVYVDYLAMAPIDSPVNDSAYIQIGEEDMPAIVDYTTFIAHLKEGGAEFQSAMPALQSFLVQAAKYNAKILQSALYKRLAGIPGGAQLHTRPPDSETPQTRG